MVNSLINSSREIILNTFEKGDTPLHGLGQHDQIVQSVSDKNPHRVARFLAHSRNPLDHVFALLPQEL